MLPLTLQFIIAMIAYALNERMARKAEYLQEEVRVLKEALAAATGKTRIAFTPEQRRRLALTAQGADARGTQGLLPDRAPGDDSGAAEDRESALFHETPRRSR